MPSAIDHANDALLRARAGGTLVLWNKLASAGRNLYAAPTPIPAMLPDVALADYGTWGPLQPAQVLDRDRGRTLRCSPEPAYDKALYPRLAEHLRTSGKPPLILAWFSNRLMQDCAVTFGGRILALPQAVRQRVEDKAALTRFLAQAGLPASTSLPTASYPSKQRLPDYQQLRATFGSPFILQGWSYGGNGTFIVEDAESFAEARAQVRGRLRVTPFCGQQFATVYLLSIPRSATSCAVYVDLPSHKLSGLASAGAHRTMGSGCDWTLPYRRGDPARMVEQLTQLADYLFVHHGVQGHWNVEGFLTEEGFLIHEINCRLGGGTEVASANQLLRGCPPFLLAHALHFLGGDLSSMPDWEAYNQATIDEMGRRTLPGCFYLKLFNREPHPVQLGPGGMGSGVYRLAGERLVWAGPGQSTRGADADQLHVLAANLPPGSVAVGPGLQLCTLEGVGRSQHLFTHAQTLSPFGERIVEAAYGLFAPAPVHPAGRGSRPA